MANKVHKRTIEKLRKLAMKPEVWNQFFLYNMPHRRPNPEEQEYFAMVNVLVEYLKDSSDDFCNNLDEIS